MQAVGFKSKRQKKKNIPLQFFREIRRLQVRSDYSGVFQY